LSSCKWFLILQLKRRDCTLLTGSAKWTAKAFAMTKNFSNSLNSGRFLCKSYLSVTVCCSSANYLHVPQVRNNRLAWPMVRAVLHAELDTASGDPFFGAIGWFGHSHFGPISATLALATISAILIATNQRVVGSTGYILALVDVTIARLC
jgi:hypothetical protein